MHLVYGLGPDGELICVDAVERGRTSLVCPYCGRRLLAKKGAIKVPHFAHDGPTCVASASDATWLPAFDKFDLHLSSKMIATLRSFSVYVAGKPRSLSLRYREAEALGLIQRADRGTYELTTRGKIPLGHLPLKPFLAYQTAAFAEKHAHLEAAAQQAEDGIELERCRVDLRLYRAQWRRLLQSTLYFVEVTHTSPDWAGPFYKIGVTTRDMAARLGEIEADLEPHLGAVSLKVLATWPHYGSLEFYFKHRYQKHQCRLGSLTEYFGFRDLERIFGQDLGQIASKEWSPLEQSIYAEMEG